MLIFLSTILTHNQKQSSLGGGFVGIFPRVKWFAWNSANSSAVSLSIGVYVLEAAAVCWGLWKEAPALPVGFPNGFALAVGVVVALLFPNALLLRFALAGGWVPKVAPNPPLLVPAPKPPEFAPKPPLLPKPPEEPEFTPKLPLLPKPPEELEFAPKPPDDPVFAPKPPRDPKPPGDPETPDDPSLTPKAPIDPEVVPTPNPPVDEEPAPKVPADPDAPNPCVPVEPKLPDDPKLEESAEKKLEFVNYFKQEAHGQHCSPGKLFPPLQTAA